MPELYVSSEGLIMDPNLEWKITYFTAFFKLTMKFETTGDDV
jgi:hypothetical protein